MSHYISWDILLLFQAEDVRSQISTIADYVKEVKAKHSEILADPNFDEGKHKYLTQNHKTAI